MEVDFETSLKIAVMGNGGVGKTSMLTKYAKGVMTTEYKKTIGTGFFEKNVFLRNNGETVKLMLWDIAGQDMFDKLARQYYRGSGAVVYVLSTTDRNSFQDIERWKRKVEREGEPLVSVLVQNKIDLLDDAKVTNEEVEALAQRLGMRLYRTSVLEDIQVKEVFEYLAQQYLDNGGADAVAEQEETVAEIKAPEPTEKVAEDVPKKRGRRKKRRGGRPCSIM